MDAPKCGFAMSLSIPSELCERGLQAGDVEHAAMLLGSPIAVKRDASAPLLYFPYDQPIDVFPLVTKDTRNVKDSGKGKVSSPSPYQAPRGEHGRFSLGDE